MSNVISAHNSNLINSEMKYVTFATTYLFCLNAPVKLDFLRPGMSNMKAQINRVTPQDVNTKNNSQTLRAIK